jgi:hypothetical protein
MGGGELHDFFPPGDDEAFVVAVLPHAGNNKMTEAKKRKINDILVNRGLNFIYKLLINNAALI